MLVHYFMEHQFVSYSLHVIDIQMQLFKWGNIKFQLDNKCTLNMILIRYVSNNLSIYGQMISTHNRRKNAWK